MCFNRSRQVADRTFHGFLGYALLIKKKILLILEAKITLKPEGYIRFDEIDLHVTG